MKSEAETLQTLRQLAGTIPCVMCRVKGGGNIEKDGGCRHRPMIDSSITDEEVVTRLTFAVSVWVYQDPFLPEETKHNHLGEVFTPNTCPACKSLSNTPELKHNHSRKDEMPDICPACQTLL